MTKGADMPAVLSVGRLYCDLIFTDLARLPTLGTEVFTDGFGAHAGGGAFITAAHLADLGHHSALATMLPASPFLDMIRAEISASEVDLSLSTPLPKTSGPQVTVAMVQGGDRAFLTRRAGPPFPRLSATDVQRRGFRHLHVGELNSLVAQPEVLTLARSIGMTVSVDCSWDDNFRADAIRPLLKNIDVFLPNETEWQSLRQLGIDDDAASLIIVKRGDLGARAITDGRIFDAAATPLDPIDTTGAGDAFNAGFLSAWLRGSDLGTALADGNSKGARTIRTRGGFSKDHALRAGAPLAGE